MNENIKLQSALDFYKNHQYEKSLKIFDDELCVNKSKINFFKNSKCLIFNLKKYRNMIQYLDKILEINPKDSQILARKGHLLEITFQRQNALLCLNKALEIDSKNNLANYTKGIVLYNLEQFEESIKYFDKILETSSMDYGASLGKGLCLEMLGMKEDSVKYFVNAFQWDLTDPELLHSISYNLTHFCFPINALTYANYILKINPDDLIANSILNLVEPRQNKLREKILELYEKYVHREPSIDEIHFWENKIIQGKSFPWIEDEMKNSEEGLNYFN